MLSISCRKEFMVWTAIRSVFHTDLPPTPWHLGNW